jgi:hypothetical protein
MRRFGVALSLVAALAGAGAGVAWRNGAFDAPVVPGTGEHPWAERRTVAGVENFGEIVPAKFIGELNQPARVMRP